MAQNTPRVEKLQHQEEKNHTPQLYLFPTPQETQESVDCMSKQAMAETESLPYHRAKGTDTKLVCLILVSDLCVQNSVLQSIPVAMPSWEKLILLQETAAKHDRKLQA